MNTASTNVSDDIEFVNAVNQENETRKGNGEGTLYYNESRQCWTLQHTFSDMNGQKYRKAFCGKTEKEVLKKYNQFLRDLATGKVKSKKQKNVPITICMLVSDAFERDFKYNSFSEAAYVRKLHSLSVIEKHKIGNVPIRKINNALIDDFLISITYLSDSVIKKVYATLNYGFKLAVQQKIIYENPLDNPMFRRPTSKKVTKKIRAFTLGEQNLFTRALEDYKTHQDTCDYKLQLLIELYTGMRMGEINALSPSDVDLKNKVVHISRTITRGIDYKSKVGDRTKTEKGVRDVPLNKIAVSIFELALKEYKPNKYNLLFYNYKKDKVITTAQVNEFFKRVCLKAGIKGDVNQHMLRHTFATRCIEAGVDAFVLKDWLGHKDISVTLNTYCDVFAQLNHKQIDMLQDYADANLLKLECLCQ